MKPSRISRIAILFALLTVLAGHIKGDDFYQKTYQEMEAIVASQNLTKDQKIAAITAYLKKEPYWPGVLFRLDKVDKVKTREVVQGLLRKSDISRVHKEQLERYLQQWTAIIGDTSRLKTIALSSIIFNEREPSEFFEAIQKQLDENRNASFRIVYTIGTAKYLSMLKKKQETGFVSPGGYLELRNIPVTQALEYFAGQMKNFKVTVREDLIIVDVVTTKKMKDRTNK